MTNQHGYCPKCQADLDGDVIPADIAHHYSGKKWGRALGLEISGAYDGILIWRCPDCDHNWPRFPDGHRLNLTAQDIISSWEAKSNASS